jgi:hypothetical protein
MFALAIGILVLVLLYAVRARPSRGARGLIAGAPFDPFDPQRMR